MRRAATFILSLALLSSVSATPLHAGGRKKGVRKSGVVKTVKDAKAIAEQETGGLAISARRIPLNGASGGWEVEVHMPRQEKGWRCVVDADTWTVHTKSRIDNPPAPRHR